MARRLELIGRLGLILAVLLAGTVSSAPLRAQTDEGMADEGAAEADRNQAAGSAVARLPRFAALRAPEVNMRTGPGTRYPIDWVYRRQNLPVEIIDEYDTWRRVRDFEGTAGWVHQSMLHGRRYIMVAGDTGAVLRRDPQDDSRPVAKLQRGVIGRLESCGDVWCVVEAANIKGWLRRDQVFGVYPDEEVR